MPKIAALGSLSSRGFGEFAQQTAANYIEDVFSTYLYTGNGATGNTIINGIDLLNKGGMVWVKNRSTGTTSHIINDTVRGYGTGSASVYNKALSSNTTSEEGLGITSDYIGSALTPGFRPDGFLVSYGGNGFTNNNGSSYASWTFRKKPKFFDVITFTATGSLQTINHSLGSAPGMIVIKNTGTSSVTNDWIVYHRSLGTSQTLYLNSSIAAQAVSYISSVGSATFNFNSYSDAIGNTFVAYLFAHNAGGFGADGSQNVISCGSFTTDGSGNATVSLGYEPQWILAKNTTGTGNWILLDTMRGWDLSSSDRGLCPNLTSAEFSYSFGNPTATGFIYSDVGIPNTPYIYMAIRRGPMRTPTDATKVYTSNATTNTTGAVITTNFVVDLAIDRVKAASYNWQWQDRLRGSPLIQSNSTSAEFTPSPLLFTFDNNTGVKTNGFLDGGGNAQVWAFSRAPGFFDVVCYSGTYPTAQTVAHNLGVPPELMIVKSRSNASLIWCVYSLAWLNQLGLKNRFGILNTTDNLYQTDFDIWNNQLATSSSFQVNANNTNSSGATFVAYLFASCPGVSKVGIYSGTGSTQTINCGFTGGARYVLIKRADGTGDWWIWDTARGMIAGTDPRLAYNSTAAETNANWVYTTTGGFQIVTSDATVNASGGTYIYLAIA